MTRFLLGGLAAVLFVAATSETRAESRTILIASGALGSTYRDIYAPNLGKLLFGYKVRQKATSGSGENLELLAAGTADVIFSQADVYAARLASDPERYGHFAVLGKVGDECVYVARRTTSDVSSLAQLGEKRKKPAVVAIGPAGGGASGTWDHLKTLVPGLASVETRNEGGTLALNQLAVGAYDAVVWVTDPTNFEHPSFRAVELNKSLTLMSLTDAGLINSLPDGTEVYRSRILKLEDEKNPRELATICTSALVLARKDASPDLIKKVADTIALRAEDIAPDLRRR